MTTAELVQELLDLHTEAKVSIGEMIDALTEVCVICQAQQEDCLRVALRAKEKLPHGWVAPATMAARYGTAAKLLQGLEAITV